MNGIYLIGSKSGLLHAGHNILVLLSNTLMIVNPEVVFVVESHVGKVPVAGITDYSLLQKLHGLTIP
jgi:hypothetical protein